MSGPNRAPVAATDELRFPFDVDFQKSLVRLLTEDDGFAYGAIEYLKPEFFEHQAVAWAFGVVKRYVDEYGAIPSMRVIKDATRNLDASIQPVYQAVVDQISGSSLRDGPWLRDQVLDFVKRNLFVRAFRKGRELYNENKTVEAYDLMMEEMEKISTTAWEPPDQEWFFAELPKRQAIRRMADEYADVVPTGFPWLDTILNGGLSLGELGVWLAYYKVGKSTMLLNLGVNAVRRMKKVLHIILEGSRKQISDRYEAAFLREVYHEVKRGNITPQKYAAAIKEYQLLRDTLVLRSFVDQWDVNVLTIDRVLKDLERTHGWRPELIIIDYADLMTGRHPKQYRSETESQRAAYKDVKRLTNRGYAIWTAAQAQRPEKSAYEKPHFVRSNQTADTIDKMRVTDFSGSLNQTAEEKRVGVMRLLADIYRDNPADQWLTVRHEAEKMWMHQQEGLISPSMPYASPDPELGGRQSSAF